MKILGLDLSLQSTGVTVVDHAPDGLEISTNRVRSTGKKNASYNDTAERLSKLAEGILPGSIIGSDVALAVIESPSFGSSTPSQFERYGLWWMVACRLNAAGIAIATVAPSTLKVYALGRGRGEKDEVLAAVIRRYPDLDVTGNDIADAVLLAAMGSRHLGFPIEGGTIPKTHSRAMDSAKWPAA